jgi:hypothetical protein
MMWVALSSIAMWQVAGNPHKLPMKLYEGIWNKDAWAIKKLTSNLEKIAKESDAEYDTRLHCSKPHAQLEDHDGHEFAE